MWFPASARLFNRVRGARGTSWTTGHPHVFATVVAPLAPQSHLVRLAVRRSCLLFCCSSATRLPSLLDPRLALVSISCVLLVASWLSKRLGMSGRAEEPQQTHAQGHPQDASDDARPFLDGVGHPADSPEAGSMQKQTQTYAEKVRQEERGHTHTHWDRHSCGHIWA